MNENTHATHPLSSTLFWVFLAITIIANFIISTILVPIMLVMTKLSLYFSITFIGFSFGYILHSILISIEELDKGHHIIAGILIPSLALINVAIFTRLSNNLIKMMHLKTPSHNPLIIGIVYVIAFITPYITHTLIKFKNSKTD